MKKIRLFEAFAGIGSQRRALKSVVGNNFEIAGLAEWYVPAIVMYQIINNDFSKKNVLDNVPRDEVIDYLNSKCLSWDSKKPVSKNFWNRKSQDILNVIYSAVKKSEEEGNIFDVRTLHERTLESIDILTYSFPCQDLSQQGIQKGMKKNSGTRSGLLWEIEKAIDNTPKNNLPKILLMENVPALLNKTNELELKEWLIKLENMGYKNSIGILNAADFGSPQARRRVFMISSRNKKIELPVGKSKPGKLNDILEKNVEDKFIMTNLEKYDFSEFSLTKSNIKKCSLINYTKFNSEAYVYDPDFTGPTLTASGANSRIKIYDKGFIRRMSPLESFRYMGFDDEDYKKIDEFEFLTDTQKIFVCGNSISIEVLKAIFERIDSNE
ncbi:DNA (cytosine-5)-methyltransferase 1 [Spiroplasma chinense]|uniref:Cytosine-specific methyltransferase n=1 Tax=Spiroplasma chinense TaxID=216932 RepID=A0A5B9Y4K1_9MOLU|nr:DNA (cytosine-5-)-methyltransferase [Spiroplasma chinense]QEH62014.1 DNA (cytosine-5)-methyltransferase 1 [Spiroplasma chinense]